jgi:hypothetical protein
MDETRSREPRDEFDADLHRREDPVPGHAGEVRPAGEDKDLHDSLDALAPEEMARLTVLRPDARLAQGSTYLDLDQIGMGPFTAMGGEGVPGGHRVVPKRETDHELWNRLMDLVEERAREGARSR